MGDRTWAIYTIKGEIPTIEAFFEICACAANEYLQSDDGSCFETPQQAALYLTSGSASFHDAEAYFGRIDALEADLQEHQIPYAYTHGNGGSYDRGGGYWSPEEADDYCGELPGLGLMFVENALNQDDPLDAFRNERDRLQKSTGAHLPPLSIPQSVIEEAINRGLLPGSENKGLATYRVKMQETVFYVFEVAVPDGEDPERAAETLFTAVGPKDEWFSHCEERTVVEVTAI